MQGRLKVALRLHGMTKLLVLNSHTKLSILCFIHNSLLGNCQSPDCSAIRTAPANRKLFSYHLKIKTQGRRQGVLSNFGITCSMSRKGNCWDNAAMESFFHSLKIEWVGFEDYKTRSEARASLFDYIELFYNRQRRHSALKYRIPLAFENAGGVS